MVTTDVASFHRSGRRSRKRASSPRESEIAWIPRQTVRVEGADAEAVLRLIESFDELDDVQKVDANFDIDADVMAGIRGVG